MSRFSSWTTAAIALGLAAVLCAPAWGQEEPTPDVPPAAAEAAQPAEAADPYPAPTTPEAAFEGFMAAMRAGDWDAYADRMHPEALAEFQSAFSRLSEVDDSGEMFRMFFGVEDLAGLAELSPEEFFARFLENISRTPIMGDLLQSASASIIGSVPEGDVVHVVYRISMGLEGETITKVEVAPFRKHGDAWRALLTGSLHEMMQALLASLEQ